MGISREIREKTMQIPDIKHLIPFVIYLAILLVGGGALVGAAKRLARGEFPALTEAAYFLAGCGLLLWGAH
jgi:hypothetical protein